jgi:hypothetical protein
MVMLARSVNGWLFIRTDAVIYPTRDGHELIDDDLLRYATALLHAEHRKSVPYPERPSAQPTASGHPHQHEHTRARLAARAVMAPCDDAPTLRSVHNERQ